MRLAEIHFEKASKLRATRLGQHCVVLAIRPKAQGRLTTAYRLTLAPLARLKLLDKRGQACILT